MSTVSDRHRPHRLRFVGRRGPVADELRRARDRLLDLGPDRRPEHDAGEAEIVALQTLAALLADVGPERALAALCLARMLLTSGQTTARVLRAAFDWADEILDGLDLCEAAEVDGDLYRYEAELLEAVQELRGES